MIIPRLNRPVVPGVIFLVAQILFRRPLLPVCRAFIALVHPAVGPVKRPYNGVPGLQPLLENRPPLLAGLPVFQDAVTVDGLTFCLGDKVPAAALADKALTIFNGGNTLHPSIRQGRAATRRPPRPRHRGFRMCPCNHQQNSSRGFSF